MSRRFIWCLGTVLLLAVATIVVERRIIRIQAEELSQERTARAKGTAELRAAGAELGRIRQEISRVEAALARKRAELAAEEAAPPRLWARRVRLLQQLLAELPAQQIPELRLLTPLDWADIARSTEMDTAANIRQLLAALRIAGRKRFAEKLQEALRAWLARSGGELPSDLRLLAADLAPPANLAMLERYGLLRSGRPGKEDTYLVQEHATSDAILSVGLDSWSISSNAAYEPPPGETELQAFERFFGAMAAALDGPAREGVQELGEMLSPAKLLAVFEPLIPAVQEAFGGEAAGDFLRAAARQYRRAHPDEPLANFAQLLPYLNAPATFIDLVRPAFAHLEYLVAHGRHPPDPADLAPFLAKPFDPATAFRALTVTFDEDSNALTVGFSWSHSTKRTSGKP